jgi:AcrR family transcriptional regulator
LIIFSCPIPLGGGYDDDIKGLANSNKAKSNKLWIRPRDTRRQILEGAERALRAKGLTGASTRDGTLYVHFHDRIDLFIALIQEHLPEFVEPLKMLAQRVGRRNVKANLAEALDAFITWHRHLLPVFSAVNADPELREALRNRLAERNEGPHRAVAAVEQYLLAEQQLGRVNPKANARATVMLMFGAAHYWNSVLHGVGNDLGYTREKLMKDVMDSLFAGVAPEK